MNGIIFSWIETFQRVSKTDTKPYINMTFIRSQFLELVSIIIFQNLSVPFSLYALWTDFKIFTDDYHISFNPLPSWIQHLTLLMKTIVYINALSGVTNVLQLKKTT